MKNRLNPVRGGVKQEIKGFPYFVRCRGATDLPLALVFGIKDRADIDFILGKAQIAVIGSEILRLIDQEGIQSIESFIQGLREK